MMPAARTGHLWLLIAVVGSLLLGVRSTSSVDATEEPDTSAFIDRYLEVAEQIDPALAEQLRSMCQLDPDAFEVVLRRLGPMLSGLTDLRADDPELYQRKIRELHLEATVAALAVEARRASLSDDPATSHMSQSLQTQLEAMVRAQVMTNLENRALFAQRLRAHLEELELELAVDRDEVDGLVESRLQSLSTP